MSKLFSYDRRLNCNSLNCNSLNHSSNIGSLMDISSLLRFARFVKQNLKIKKDHILLIGILILILGLVSSCSSNSGDKSGSIVELDYVSTTAGPKLTEMEVEPKDRLEEFSSFVITAILENQGSSDLSKGEVSVFAGYDESIIDFGETSVTGINILGYNEKNPVIEKIFLEFEGFINALVEETRSEVDVPIFIKTEFSYSTVLEQEVCVNTDMYDVYTGNCDNPNGEVSAAPQYSPVVVTSFNQYVSERLGIIYFTFKIENKGLGVVKEISLVEASLTTEDMVCEFKGDGEMDGYSYIFDSGEKTVDLECQFRFDPNNAAMEKILILDLFYDYIIYDELMLTVVKSK